MSKTLKTRIINKHDTEANWKLATTFIPKDGEIIIYDPDSSHSESRVKIGDGKTAVGSLKFLDENQASSLSISNRTIQLKNSYGTKIGDSVTVPQYTLPAATSSTLGGVKTGSNITNSSGTISITKSNVTSALGYTPPTTNTTYSDATTSVHGLMSADDKTKLDGIASGANNYSLPAATSSTLGGVKTGSNITNTSGTISITKTNVTSALGYTPPVSDTTYSDATTDTSGLMSADDKTKLDGIATGANKYTLPAATSSTLGGVKVGSNISNSSGTISLSKANVTNALGYTPVNSAMTGASSTAAGSTGLVPAPAKGEQGLYLRGDGEWATPTNTTYNTATTSSNGLMSSGDKSKLDGIASGANKYTLPAATSSVLGGVKTGSNITNASGTISISKSNVTNALGYTPPTTDTTYDVVTSDTDGLMSSGDKNKLDGIDSGANNYVLPTATSSVLGGIKTGSNITNSEGVISITKANVTGALGYTPPTTNTTYSAATTSASGLMSSTDKAKLDGIASGANKYTLPSATSSVLGGVKIGSNVSVSSGTISLSKSNVTGALGYTPATQNAFTGASVNTSGTAVAGSSGLVPAPDAGEDGLYLKGDGTWATPTNTTYGNATTSVAGLMSSSDKSKLDGIASGANKYTLPNATSSTLGGVKIGSNISVSSGTISLSKSNVTSALGYTPPTSDTTYDDATTSNSGLMSADDKSKLDGIASGANNYSLPAATSSTLGGVKIGSNITVSSGTISVSKANVTGALGYTPPTTNTTYSVATTSANGLMSSTDKSKLDGIASGANNYSLPTASSSTLGGVKVGSNITLSSGTISLSKSNVTTALGYTPPTTNTTYSAATTSAAGLMSASDKSKLDGIATGANNYSLPTAGTTLGGVLTTSTVTSNSGYTAVPIIDGVPYYKNSTYSTFKASGDSAKSGLVPKPSTTAGTTHYLREDATWVVPPFAAESHEHTYLKNFFPDGQDSRPTTMNYNMNSADYAQRMYYSIASSACTEGKPPQDSVVITFPWDNQGWASQMAFQAEPDPHMFIRGAGVDANNDSSWDASWKTVLDSSNYSSYAATAGHGHSNATTSAAGFMSTSDKSKLDGIASNANNYTHPTTSGNKHIPSGGSAGQFLKWSADGTAVWAADNNTTYSAGTGISLSGTTINNSGVRSISTGTSNGTISVNTNGTSANVSVKGLGTAAYTASTAYAAASHSHSYLPLSGGTTTGTTTLASHLKVAYESSTIKIYFVS